MSIEIKMPALSPTMEEGTLAKWLVKEGDTVKSGDIMAEIETDKATMEFEAVDEGTIAKILIAEGTDGVKVGAVIAILAEEGEDAASVSAPTKSETPQPAAKESEAKPNPADPNKTGSEAKPVERTVTQAEDHGRPADAGASDKGGRVKASPLARRIAADKGIDLSGLSGSGPNGRIVKADVEGAKPGAAPAAAKADAAPTAAPAPVAVAKPATVPDIPHEATKLSNMRKTIARRLTESKQTVPHIYLTVDIQLDALLKLRGELNASLESRGVKLSVNDMLVKALAQALIAVPKCNVMFTPDQLISFKRADISVAVSTPSGLITPIVVGADTKSLSAISTEVKDLAARAKDNKLKPEEFQGGTASISNMGMFGIKQFEAVINPPQGMIMAIGAGEKRPYIVNGELAVATVMSATGSFDHRAIDGADGAELMKVFKDLVERPLGMLA
ncbi:pyruvate dehydrogenase complex dihydrolipoamide acetyltransferase [Sphingomonas melonis TY]|jgi:pyruvate dehydrogenase E2 component (dihydrolipoamide acetyltransferase)|uniref:Acetyltransferase component of pyruvate dehydrogenase complex n=1 Tax=Sphingomonas melonis TY TaxID=621456 RepID=A0A175Y7H3_9SPHN|nr:MULTISPECIES: pyruvate dehydrogenase complex dihydrolipoamide acetyltransferase [Sphingomonas]AOW24274.1 pyruvate dehydrogenase complex dihydrolipoamide acetyltransferase [Sphingomonas melonis TY]ATI55328.1 pyruvate dehydrogenase complex dihydrolipoamide acetyltransferase [Sphingomonas melonis]KZB96316.1 pyruvate dehydrogenase complex dihydrolipoamide acetyltransferase [Sphingomonas melonis TY]MBI0531479.1 pyruvate dehydrogenase complex dihydrolipoamide acetyltransferase [Sphingomonas sp. TX